MTRYKTVFVILLSIAVLTLAFTTLSGFLRDVVLVVATAVGAGMIGGTIGRALLRAHLRAELHRLRQDVALAKGDCSSRGSPDVQSRGYAQDDRAT